MKMLRIVLGVLVFSSIGHASCLLPQYETCDANRGVNEFQNCLVRNRREDARYKQCRDQERRDQEREKEEQREQERERQDKAREKYCRQYPDSLQCK